jgi:hypothetical protein
MRFQVPQFIEVEDKVFGPLTIKQFVYIAGAVGIAFIIWTLLPTFLAIIVATPIVALALALAFYKINNRPFVTALEAAFNYTLKNKLYIWKKQDKKIEPRKKTPQEPLLSVPKLSHSRLRDLAWGLDIKESIYSNEKQRGSGINEMNHGNTL